MTREELKVKRIKARLYRLEPFLPGSISRQWNVCGTPGCRCKDPKNPQRHGPYYQLSYTANGRSSSRFVKKTELREARKRVARFRLFKRLNAELLDACIELARKHGL